MSEQSENTPEVFEKGTFVRFIKTDDKDKYGYVTGPTTKAGRPYLVVQVTHQKDGKLLQHQKDVTVLPTSLAHANIADLPTEEQLQTATTPEPPVEQEMETDPASIAAPENLPQNKFAGYNQDQLAGPRKRPSRARKTTAAK